MKTFRGVKIRDATYDDVLELLEIVRGTGWSSIGAARGDKASIAALIDEAVTRLKKETDGKSAVPLQGP